MDEKYEIIELLQRRQALEEKLNSLVYGSVEIREKDNCKYIYIHYREEGISNTKYVGEYTDELYNLIINNNIEAKQIKKDIKAVTKRLRDLNYIEEDLEEKVMVNIDFAKRHLVDTIYKQAILEGVATTFADTESIIEGGIVNNMTSKDIMKVVNLKHAWEFILNKNIIQSPQNLNLLCEINRLVQEDFYYNAGKIRSVPVSIGGTKWKPELLIESVIREDLVNILNKKISVVDKAIEMILYIMKKQIFVDGNKRTAIIFVNHYLISKGVGIIVIPEDKVEEFKSLLVSYYEGKDIQKIKEFLKKDCYINIKSK